MGIKDMFKRVQRDLELNIGSEREDKERSDYRDYDEERRYRRDDDDDERRDRDYDEERRYRRDDDDDD